jgi:Uma2 family endonuclease
MATVKTRIGPADHGRRMTIEEYREADEEPGYRYELARGIVEVTDFPDEPHCQIVCNLRALLYAYRTPHPGLILRIGGAAECQVWIPEMVSGRNPDVAVVFTGTPKDDRGRQPPSLVAEVVSRGGEVRDYQTKREEYATFGIREYWIVDPRLQQVTVLILQEGGDWSEQVFRGTDVIASGLLAGFAGTVADLWVNADLDTNEAG